MLMELLVAVVGAAVAGGQVLGHPHPVEVGVLHPCCHLWHSKRLTEFNKCVELIGGPRPDCEVNRQGCLYHDRTYKAGETVAVFPSKCLKLECMQHYASEEMVVMVDVSGGGGGQPMAGVLPTATVLMMPVIETVIVDSGCGCCMKKGRMYPNGYEDTTLCSRYSSQTCVDGKWVGKPLDPICQLGIKDCTLDELVFKHGDIIELHRNDTNGSCSKLWCQNGETSLETYDCCCILGGEIVPCGEVTPPVIDSCSKETCDNGIITSGHHHDCCIVKGKMYENQQRVGLSADTCYVSICSHGHVMQVPSGNCCSNLHGKMVPPGSAMLRDASKCLLSLCSAEANITDLSIPHSCGCCEMGDKLFMNGTHLQLSTCMSLTCVNSTWTAITSGTSCLTCSIGYPHVTTFDDHSYNFFGECSYIMVQRGTEGHVHVPSITTRFRVCSQPFTDELSCVGDVVINHNNSVKVTLLAGGGVKVNGALVSLPYGHTNHTVFIWDNGQEIGVITFHGFVVWYSKSETRPALRIVAPSTEINRDWYGLCGAFDGNHENDFYTRDRLVISDAYTFASSWTSMEEEAGVTCLNQMDKEDGYVCPAARQHHFATKCAALLQILVAANCTSGITQDWCIKDLCLCYPQNGETCYLRVGLAAGERCLAQGVHLLPDVIGTPPSSIGKHGDVMTVTLRERAMDLAQVLKPVMQEYFGKAVYTQQFVPHFKKAVENVMKSLKPSLFEYFINVFPSFTEFLQEISPSLLKMEETQLPSRTAFLKAITSTFPTFLLEIEPYLLQYSEIMSPLCEKFYHYIYTVFEVLGKELGPIVSNYIEICLEGKKEVLGEIFKMLSLIDKEVKETVDIYQLGKLFLDLGANLTQIKMQEVEQALELKKEAILAIRATTKRIMASGIKRKSLQCTLDPAGFYSAICPG